MSNQLFTPPPSLGWSVFKTPELSTIIQRATSGKSTRASLWANPIWNYKLTWEILKGFGGAPTPIQQIIDFFLSRKGAFDTFLYTDPTDNTVAGQLLGFGDGTTKNFQLARSFTPNGNIENIQNPNAVSAIYLNGVPQSAFSYSVGAENLLLFSQAFTNAIWVLANTSASNPVVTDNAVVAPDGTTSGASIVYPSTIGSTVVSQISQISKTPGRPSETLTFSVYLKVPSGSSTIQLYIIDGNGFGFPGTPLTPTVTSSWTRYSITITCPGIVTGSPGVIIRANNQAGFTLHAWGAQLERWPSAPTIYVPTTNVILQPNGLVTFGTAPPNGNSITADFNFYYRLRFKNDLQEFEEFMNNLWLLKTLEMVSERL